MGAPRIGELIPEGTLVVAPTARKARMIARAHVTAGGVLMGLRVTTFPEFTDILARQLEVMEPVLDAVLAPLVLEDAIRTAGLDVGIARAQRGLRRELLRVIDACKAAAIAPDDLHRAANDLPPSADGTRLRAIAAVYRAYEATLARIGFLDRHGREWAVAERLSRCLADGRRPPALAGVERLRFAEIYDFSVVQFLIATTCIRLVGDAELVVFAHPENVDATRFLDRTWNRFVETEPIAEHVLPEFVVRGGRTGSLAAALRGVFAAEPAVPVPADGAIRLREAPSRYGEVEAVGREVWQALASGVAPHRIGIVVRDMRAYRDLIADVCRRFRIPLSMRSGGPLLGTAMAQTVLAVARCAGDGVSRRTLLDLLQSDYLRAGDRMMRQLVAASGYVNRVATPLARCLGEAIARRAVSPRLAARVDRVLAFAAALEALEHPATIGQHVRSLRRCLRTLRFRPVARVEQDAAIAQRDAAAWGVLDATLDAIEALADRLGMPAVSAETFRETLVTALEGANLPDDPGDDDGVAALSVLDARGLDFDIVYLLGLADGHFPAPHRENPLLPDGLMRRVNRAVAPFVAERLSPRAQGVPLRHLLRTAREANLEDPFLFFLGLSMAEETVVLSYPSIDERGSPTVRSPFIDEVAACVDGLATEVVDAGQVIPPRAVCLDMTEALGRSVLDRWSGIGDAGLGATLAAGDPHLATQVADVDRRGRVEEARARYFLMGMADPGAFAGPYVGRLGRAAHVAADRLERGTVRATQIDHLVQCRFRFLAARVLGLEGRETNDLDPDGRDRGLLAHALLEAVYRDWAVLPDDPPKLRAVVAAAASRLAERASTMMRPHDQAFLALVWGTLVDGVTAVLGQERAYERAPTTDGVVVARDVERGVTWPVAIGDRVVTIRGRVDRVDHVRRGDGAAALRIVDYKLTRYPGELKAKVHEKRLGVSQMQLPLYALALEPDVTESVAYVAPLAPVGPETTIVREPVSPDTLSRASGTLREQLEQALDGDFRVAPRWEQEPEQCETCPYPSLCRVQRPPLEDEFARE